MSIVAIERAKYQRAWTAPEYRRACHGRALWLKRRDLFPAVFDSALDIGCGLGYQFAAWCDAGIDAWAVDIAENCLADDVRRDWGRRLVVVPLWEMTWARTFDVGLCADVMEHIPPKMVRRSLERIAACCEVVVFKIAHEPNSLGDDVLHLTLEPVDWWMDAMQRVSGRVDYIGMIRRELYPVVDSIVRWKP